MQYLLFIYVQDIVLVWTRRMRCSIHFEYSTCRLKLFLYALNIYIL